MKNSIQILVFLMFSFTISCVNDDSNLGNVVETKLETPFGNKIANSTDELYQILNLNKEKDIIKTIEFIGNEKSNAAIIKYINEFNEIANKAIVFGEFKLNSERIEYSHQDLDSITDGRKIGLSCGDCADCELVAVYDEDTGVLKFECNSSCCKLIVVISV